MNPLILITVVPIISGILGFLIYRLRNEINFLGTIITLYYAFYLFITTRKPIILNYYLFSIKKIHFGFYFDHFSGVIILAIAIISFLVLIYSLRAMRGYKYLKSYYLLLLTTESIANALILANNFIFLFILSIISLLILYIFTLITTNMRSIIEQNEQTSAFSIANPMLLFVGLSNIVLLVGIIILINQLGNLFIVTTPRLTITSSLQIIAFILILVSIIGKVGLIPLHSWTLKLTKSPVTVMTLMPMIIDKIVGIYLLFRISYFIFNISQTLLVRFVIFGVGGVGIVIAGVLALKEKEAYRLLTFSSITQIGLIFIGIGCANPLGLAGSIYHLINYLTFQPSLLLTTGSVEYWIKNTYLDNFEGLWTKMPITFFALLIAVLASSGVPPLNGFFSKWLLFQGILSSHSNMINFISILLMIIVFLGCLITPIYFFRLLYAFRGRQPKYSQKIRDPGFTMWFSPALLSILCIVLGIFANSLSWKTITLPTINYLFPDSSNINPWTFGSNVMLLVISLIIGILIYYMKASRKPRIVASS